MLRSPLAGAAGAGVIIALLTAACEQGGRSTWERGASAGTPSSGAATTPLVQTTTFQAGPETARPAVLNPYAGAIEEGKRYYIAFNCAGCHGEQGGGGIGPPFAVRSFIYGRRPENVFQSIVQGRPNGMPSFGGKVPDEVVWKIVAYVTSLALEGEGAADDRGEEGS